MCPLEYVKDEVWTVIECADLLKKGLPPVGAGMLDQAQVFIEAARFIWAEQARWRASLGILSNE